MYIHRYQLNDIFIVINTHDYHSSTISTWVDPSQPRITHLRDRQRRQLQNEQREQQRAVDMEKQTDEANEENEHQPGLRCALLQTDTTVENVRVDALRRQHKEHVARVQKLRLLQQIAKKRLQQPSHPTPDTLEEGGAGETCGRGGLEDEDEQEPGLRRAFPQPSAIEAAPGGPHAPRPRSLM